MKSKHFGMGLAALGLAFTSSVFTQFNPATFANIPAASAAVKERAIAPTNKSNIKLNSEFQLKINQVANLPSEKLKIRFLRVTEDSRCPANARCITAGKAAIAVNIVQNNQDLGEFILATDPQEAAVKTFAGNFTIKLVDIQPPKMTTEEIKPSAYRVTLIVSKS